MTTAIRLDQLRTVKPSRQSRPRAFRWASSNRVRHWARAVARAIALGMADVGAALVVRALLRAIRDQMVFGDGISRFAALVVPPGALAGWRFAAAVLVSLGIAGAYRPQPRRRAGGRLLAAAAAVAFMLLYGQAALWAAPVTVLRLGSVTAVIAAALAGSRALLGALIRMAARADSPNRVVVVRGGPSDWVDPAHFVHANGDGRRRYRVVGTIAANADARGRFLDRLPRVIENQRADTVLVTGPLADHDFAFVADTALASGCRLLAAPRLARFPGVAPREVWEGGTTLVELTAPSRQVWHLAAKRVLDVCLAAIALVLLSPLFLVIGALIRLESKGPAIFVHRRLGERGRLFRCYKFRSMRPDAEQVLRGDSRLYQLYVDNGYKLPAHLDPRLTRVGRFLRECSLDELPQLLNVVLGDMSLVGPRPIVPDELSHYGPAAPLFLSRKPGITGYWAAHGRSDVGYPDRAEMELRYARQWSLSTDARIVLRTIPAVAWRRGAH